MLPRKTHTAVPSDYPFGVFPFRRSARMLMKMFHAIVLALVSATIADAPSPAPSPAPSASPTPTPAYSLDGAFMLYNVHTTNVNATGALDEATGSDIADRTDVSNALLTLTKNTGTLRFFVTGGAYALPVVGQAINLTTQQSANSWLYGFVPLAAVQYVPNAHLTISAGKQASLLGQESLFTFQNLNIQRGLTFAQEPTIGRGLRAAYVQGKFTGDLEYNDGYYSGNAGRALEGLAGWLPSASTSVQFAFIVPGSNTAGNVTSAIANKREYDLMITQQFGKLQLLPYALVVNSPSSSQLGYRRSESALGLVVLANYAFSSTYSLGGRYESFANHSATGDASPNADLLGFGSGSSATTWTLTPALQINDIFARAEYSSVTVSGLASGLGFGNLGTGSHQSRLAFEFGAQF